MPYRYSQRLSWNFSSNVLSEHVNRRRRSGEVVLDLTRSNPTELFSDYPHSEIAIAFAETGSFRYKPDPHGIEAARIAVSEYYKAQGVPISPDRLILTASTSEAYAILFKLFCNPADEVVVPVPSYPLFDFLADLECVRVKNYRLEYDGSWYLDFDHLQRQITPSTRAIIIVNPNNPTGSFLKPHEREKLSQIAGERSVPIISDEVFLDYSFGPSPEAAISLIGSDDVLSFSLNGLSKAAAMPQMKLGWIAINGPEAERARACERLEFIADTYLSVGTPVQRAAPRLFKIGAQIRQSIRERARTNLRRLQEILLPGPAHALQCDGGWSAIIRLPGTRSETSWTLRFLNECGILVQPGYFFDMASEPYIVVSLITPPDEFEEGIVGIKEVVVADR